MLKLYVTKTHELLTVNGFKQNQKRAGKELKSIRRYPRETYNETITNLIKMAKESKARKQYDEFLHRIQQAKMKELWDNTEDESWEHA